jgi:hypothetical protein
MTFGWSDPSNATGPERAPWSIRVLGEPSVSAVFVGDEGEA